MQIFTVKLGDSSVAFGFRRHFDKSEALGLACIPIRYDADAIDLPISLKQRTKRVFSRSE